MSHKSYVMGFAKEGYMNVADSLQIGECQLEIIKTEYEIISDF
ncbi:hypothetical protein [Flavobacterium gilvum]|nr:hypothetical protein [Flavobacterium gilvum]KFC59220.1 hypothetical protein FEM08_20030 [Flavobacterium gilvum]